MIADLMPQWLWNFLGMWRVELPTAQWTWRHTCRYGRNPALTTRDYERWAAHEQRKSLKRNRKSGVERT